MEMDDAILEWELQRAQEEEWEMANADELEMLENGDFEEGPPAKRALYKETAADTQPASVNPSGSTSSAQQQRAIMATSPSPLQEVDNNRQIDEPADYIIPCELDAAERRSEDDLVNSLVDSPFHGTPSSPRRKASSATPASTISPKLAKLAKASPVSLPTIPRQAPLKRPPTTQFLSSTSAAGSRAYIPLRDLKEMSAYTGRYGMCLTGSTSLLSTSFAQLQQQVDQLRLQEVIQQSESTAASSDENTSPKPIEGQLWVDEFAPRRYTDLISDEVVNKRLLRWLKRWDKVVFHKEPPASIFTSAEQNETTAQANAFNKVDGVAEGDETSKVILLTGPPGVGKTTLAHVVARHAGYTTVEINASDDRSPDRLKQAVLDATQMREVLNRQKRPNCLILDEIDGATTAAVNAVVRIVEGKKAGKGQEAASLRRPIICICNDLQASSLRALRKIAYILHFQPISTDTLVVRLEQICARKGLRVDRQVLASLCELTDGDIRSCISTLQFLAQNSKQVTLRDLKNTSVGRKDKVINVRAVWTEVFRLPTSRTKQSSLLALSTAATGSGGYRIARIRPLIEANGEYEKIMFGLFENFLSIKGTTSFDPDFKKTMVVHDWLHFFQEMQLAVQREQQFTLLRYCSYAPTAFHLMFASPNRSIIRYPKSLYDVDQLQREYMARIKQMLLDASPHMRRSQAEREFIIDTLQRLLKIISPQMRISNAAVLSPGDRIIVNNIVRIMASHNLRYVEDHGDNGVGLRLEPRLEEIVTFDATRYDHRPSYNFEKHEHNTSFSRPQPGLSLPLIVKQLVARELTTELVRRQSGATVTNEASVPDKPQAAPTSRKPNQRPTPASQPKTQEEKDAFMKARMGLSLDKQIKKEEKLKVRRDFFGRIIQEKQAHETPSQAETSTKPKLSAVIFKFHEGSSNAVRRPVRLRDLL
eukprot:m.138608 g.138608  ORF g.138608 m.138608 type:complete len:933 (+) comp15918_c0_seq3:100-2898(+)